MFKTKRARPDTTSTTGDLSTSSVKTYTSLECAEVARVSLRQLQWWDERKVVSPRHEGHRRVYLAEEVIEITVIAELRRKGFSLQKIRRVLRFLHQRNGQEVGGAARYGVGTAFGDGWQINLSSKTNIRGLLT